MYIHIYVGVYLFIDIYGEMLFIFGLEVCRSRLAEFQGSSSIGKLDRYG